MTLGAFTWWYRVHRWTSLVCTVFVLVSCLTGLPLIFDDEIDRGVGKPAESTAPAVSVDLDTLVAVARTQRPRDVVQVILSALVADGVWDALSWVALAAPVGVCVLGVHRAFR